MKTSVIPNIRHRLWLKLLAFTLCISGWNAAHAGLTLEMNVIRYHQYGYYFSPYLNTNSTPPNVPFGDYYIASASAPTNGASALYHYDTNGFNQTGGGPFGYGDFNGMMHELTNGNWSISVTNSVTTNVYHFTVTAIINSNDLPYVNITFPPDGAVNVTNQPTFTWQGPTNYNDLVVYYYDYGNYLPVTQTSLLSSTLLYQGINSFTPHYDSNSTTAVVSSMPLDNSSNPISSWISTAHLQDYATSQFTVGTVDPSGTEHTLVARYNWDGTNANGSPAGVDTSGNGHDMDYSNIFGGQGGLNSTTDAEVGPAAIQFHDGDYGSGGYVGWHTTPAALLTALSGSFSISCWIKTTQNLSYDSAPAYQGAGIVSADNGGLANDVVPIALTGSKIGFNTGGDSEDVTLNSSASVNDGNYHHIVVTRNQQTGQKIIYIDGVLDSFSSGTTNLLNAPQKLTIGAVADASNPDPDDSSEGNGYDGELDDLQIYSGVLSSNEVAQLYLNPGITASQVITAPLVARYNFEDTNSPSTDTSGNGNDANCTSGNGNPNPTPDTFSTDAAIGSFAREWFGDTSICFSPNGASGFNAISNALYGNFSWTAWIKTTNSDDSDYANAFFGAPILFDYNSNTNSAIFSITGSKVAFTVGNPNGNDTTIHSTTSVNDGNYHFIAATRNVSTGIVKIYVDGNLEASDTSSNVPVVATATIFMAGGYDLNFNGLLDDVRVYAGDLSASDVAALSGHPLADFNPPLNTTNLPWTTSGDTSWFVESTNTVDGLAAQSGSVTNYQSSTLSVTVTGPGTLTFSWACIADNQNFDYVAYLDGDPYSTGYLDDLYYSTSGFNQDGPFTIPAGTHTISWTAYSGGDNDPTEAGFLDQISFVPNYSPVITLNPFNQTNYPGYNVWLSAAVADTNSAVTWQWYKVGSGAISGATSSYYFPTNAGTLAVAGNYYAVASNNSGAANTTTAAVTFVSAPLPPDWSRAFKSAFTPVDNTQITKDYYYGCLVDTNGNLYVAAEFGGNTTFGSSSLNAGTNGDAAALVKQSATGAGLWAVGITNTGIGNSYAECIAPAPGGGVYLAGDYSGTNWLGTNKLADPGNGAMFLARFDAGGSNLWVKTFGGTNGNFMVINSLAADPSGNVTFSGLLGSGPVTIGSSNYNVVNQQGILLQADSTGAIRWSQLLPVFPQYLAYNAGRLYVSANTTISGGTTNVVIGGVSNVTDRAWALACLNDTSGQAIWVHGVGAQSGSTTGNPYFNNLIDDVPRLAVAGTNVFLTGVAYDSSAVFGPLTVNFNLPRGEYFARYDTNGNAKVATTYGSVTTSPIAAVADTNGNVYVSGDFDTFSVFGNDLLAAPVATRPFAGYFSQGFIAKFDLNGNPLWSREGVASTYGNVNLLGVALAVDGVWVSGWCQSGYYPETVPAVFGTNNVISDGRAVFGGAGGSENFIWYPGGVLAKVTDHAVAPLSLTLFNPQDNGTNFQFTFLSQTGISHAVQYRTNLVAGNWLTYSNVLGDGTLKLIPVPLSLFAPSKQGFVRVTNGVAP